MSSLKIQEQFELDAAAERVWEYLADPMRVVTCLPGATIEASEGDGTYRGSLKLKVGPASLTYRGVAKFVELDPERRRIRLEGKASEKSGGGQVRMVMESTVESLGEQRARVVVDVDVRLAGKIVRFGRGMIGVVSERLFQDFAECLAATLRADVAGADLEDGAGAASADASPAARSAHAAASLNPVLLLFRALWSRLSRLFGRGG